MSLKTGSQRKTSERQTKFRHFLALNLNDTYLFWRNIPKQNYFEVRFEDIIAKPQHETSRLCDWLEVEQKGHNNESWIDRNRANNSGVFYPEAVVANVKGILADISRRLSYENDKQE